jgi:uncharacterized protein (DUF1330 family)
MNPLKRELTKTISVEIIPAGQGDINTDRIWAINWFNYRRKWLYSLYNRLAAPHVIRVGGQLLFKGHNQRVLFGDEELARHTLLIVTYPKINDFLEMLTIKAFQLTSLLRVKAVNDFVFGFTKRIDKYDTALMPKYNGSDSYLVYHYQGNGDQEKLHESAHSHNVKMFFHGEKMARLKRLEEGKDDILAPFFMDGIILFEAENDQILTGFAKSSEFVQHKTLNIKSFGALFSRVK